MEENRREYGIDLVKTLAAAGVIVTHIAASFGDVYAIPQWFQTQLWASLARTCVPLFLLCTGALLLPPERPLTLRKLWGRSLPRLVLAMYFWAMFYLVYDLAVAGKLSAAALWQGTKEVLLLKQEFHLYYLHMALLVYALLPLTRLLTAPGRETELRYALALWAALGIVFPTVKHFWPFTLLDGVPMQWMLNMTWAASGYCLLGYVLHRRPLRPAAAWGLLAGGLALTYFGTWGLSDAAGKTVLHLQSGMTVGPALMAAGAFCLCLRVRRPRRGAWLVTDLGRASFCIYLVHVPFYRAVLPVLHAIWAPRLVTIPAATLAVLAPSFLVWLALRRVPWVRRWLI